MKVHIGFHFLGDRNCIIKMFFVHTIFIEKVFVNFKNYLLYLIRCIPFLIVFRIYFCKNDLSWEIFLLYLSFCFLLLFLCSTIDTIFRTILCKNDLSYKKTFSFNFFFVWSYGLLCIAFDIVWLFYINSFNLASFFVGLLKLVFWVQLHDRISTSFFIHGGCFAWASVWTSLRLSVSLRDVPVRMFRYLNLGDQFTSDNILLYRAM